MRCPYCGSDKDKVVDSRPTDNDAAVRRRRYCQTCSHRFTTMERPEHPPLTVVKQGGERELFSPQKLLAGVLKATNNLDIDTSAIRRAVADIEAELRETARTEVTSQRIGQAMLTALYDLHEVAYLRFASVYKGFTSRKDFQREIEALGIDKPREHS